MTKTLSSLADSDNALIVGRPTDVLNRSGNRLEFILQQMLLVNGIPNTNLARGICMITKKTVIKLKYFYEKYLIFMMCKRARLFNYIPRYIYIAIDKRVNSTKDNINTKAR